jgi:hypothetical protein
MTHFSMLQVVRLEDNCPMYTVGVE